MNDPITDAIFAGKSGNAPQGKNKPAAEQTAPDETATTDDPSTAAAPDGTETTSAPKATATEPAPRLSQAVALDFGPRPEPGSGTPVPRRSEADDLGDLARQWAEATRSRLVSRNLVESIARGPEPSNVLDADTDRASVPPDLNVRTGDAA